MLPGGYLPLGLLAVQLQPDENSAVVLQCFSAWCAEQHAPTMSSPFVSMSLQPQTMSNGGPTGSLAIPGHQTHLSASAAAMPAANSCSHGRVIQHKPALYSSSAALHLEELMTGLLARLLQVLCKTNASAASHPQLPAGQTWAQTFSYSCSSRGMGHIQCKAMQGNVT